MSHLVAELEEGARRKVHVLEARALLRAGKSWNEIAEATGVSRSTIRNWVEKVKHIAGDHELQSSDLADNWHNSGRKPEHPATEADKAALRGQYIVTNDTEETGSTQEATRMALRKGLLSPELAKLLKERRANKQPLLPESLRKHVIVPPAIVKSYRNKRNAELDYIYSPGSLKLVTDRITGERRFARAGDILEMDDGTKNFICCVPWDRGGVKGQPCADKYGVIIGRFQLLMAIDVGEYYIPGWSHIARPSGGFRQEDILATLHTIFKAHGVWDECRFENGSFKATGVKEALRMLGTRLHTVHSPRAKAFIEGLLRTIWTKTSDLPGQVGRFMGETDEENALLVKCKRGTVDPTKHFAMLGDVLKSIGGAVNERNATVVKSKKYGEWVPEERFELRRNEGRLRPLDPSVEFLFSPFTKIQQVRGCQVKCIVPFCEDLSIEFEFGHPELAKYHGEKVRLYFDPFGPDPSATVVSLAALRDRAADSIICVAPQICQVARQARESFGYGLDADLGLRHNKRSKQGVRRDVLAVMPGGKPGVTVTEQRNGEGSRVKLEVNSGTSATPDKRESSTPRRITPSETPAPRRAAPSAELPYSIRKALAEEQAD